MTKSSKPSRRTAKQPNPLKLILGPVGLAVLMVAAIAALWYWNRQEQVAFEPDTPAGEAVLTTVETFPDQGREHVSPGQPVDYDSDFPTSGPHDPTPVSPGVYAQEQPQEKLVHSLEHGNIVIYYDEPDEATLQTLEGWANQFPGAWDGIVAVPKPGLGESIVLTAWTKKLVLPHFDPDTAASFIDEYRGRGPENPVR